MNLPNKITVLRCLMIPLILLFMLPLSWLGNNNFWNHFVETYGMIVALLLFLIASLTDMFDGYIARKYKIITNLGRFLDPIADKMLIMSIMIALVQLGAIKSIFPIIIVVREFAVTGIRILAIEQGKVISASKLGKIKTVSQIIAISVVMLDICASRFIVDLLPLTFYLKCITLFIAVLFTIISGVDYVIKGYTLFKDKNIKND